MITIDPRDHTGDNPDLKVGMHYTTPGWGNVLTLVPQGENGSLIPQSFDVKFKIEEKDTYHFAFTIYETADAKAGTPRRIDLCLDGGQTYRIVEQAVQPGQYLFYDGLSAELEPSAPETTAPDTSGDAGLPIGLIVGIAIAVVAVIAIAAVVLGKKKKK